MRLRPVALALAIPAIAAVGVAAIGLRGHISSAPAAAARTTATSTPAPQTAVSPPPRSGAAFTWDGAHHVDVLFGGNGPSGALDDTWTWDGLTWRQQHPAASPPAMSTAAAAWDPGRGRVVLVGRAGFVRGAPVPLMVSADWQTWTWDGSTWQRDRDAGIASEGQEQAIFLAYDAAARHMVAAAAGHDHSHDMLLRAYTWAAGGWNVLDGSLEVTGTRLALAWDSAARTVRLMEAENGRGAVAAEHQWTWDGTRWRSLPDAPGFLGFEPNSLVTSPFAPGLVQVDPGGASTWQGHGWVTVSAGSVAPPMLTGFAVAPDPDRHTVVLFGGQAPTAGTGTISNQTWTWDGRSWSRRGGVLAVPPSPSPDAAAVSACPVMQGPPGTTVTHMGSALQVAITLPAMPPGCATRALEIGVVDDIGTLLAVQGNPIRVTTTATHLTVRWTNWCGGGATYLGIGTGDGGASSEVVRPPSCAAGGQPSLLRLVSSS
jgi:hypothetical protein